MNAVSSQVTPLLELQEDSLRTQLHEYRHQKADLKDSTGHQAPGAWGHRQRVALSMTDLTQNELKKQGLVWVLRVLKRADRLPAAPCTVATVPCRMWGWQRSGGRCAADPWGTPARRITAQAGSALTLAQIHSEQAEQGGWELHNSPADQQSPDKGKAEIQVWCQAGKPKWQIWNSRRQNSAQTHTTQLRHRASLVRAMKAH